MPELRLPDQNGEVVDIKDFSNKYVFVYFWASWCAPCGDSFPRLQKVHEVFKNMEYKDADGFVFLPVSLDASAKKWQDGIDKFELDFPIHLSDLKGMPSELSERFQFEQIPASYLVNPEGVIIGKDMNFRELSWELKKRQ